MLQFGFSLYLQFKRCCSQNGVVFSINFFDDDKDGNRFSIDIGSCKFSKHCNLCVTEKPKLLLRQNLLNKRSLIISQRRHENKYRLKTLASSITAGNFTQKKIHVGEEKQTDRIPKYIYKKILKTRFLEMQADSGINLLFISTSLPPLGFVNYQMHQLNCFP